jgi:hypothetical protein
MPLMLPIPERKSSSILSGSSKLDYFQFSSALFLVLKVLW